MPECGFCAYLISVNSTPRPEAVVPLLEAVATPFWTCLGDAIEYANELQPDPDAADPYFWSHSARFHLRNALRDAQADPGVWSLRPEVSNCGVHLLLGGMHVVRVLRSMAGTTPHAGHNPKRRSAWVQAQLPLASGGELPPLSLILDWHLDGDEPVVHVGLPYANWNFQGEPKIHWRVPMPGEGEDFSALSFPHADDDDDFGMLVLPNEDQGVG